MGDSWWGPTRDVLSAPPPPQQPPARGASTPEATSSSADRRRRATPEKPHISLPRVKHFSAVLPWLFIRFWHMSYAFLLDQPAQEESSPKWAEDGLKQWGT